MTSRILPPAEWPKLAGTEAETVWPQCKPETTRVLVVEDGDRIVGVWLGLHVVHAECVWIAEDFRHSPRVIHRLLRGMGTIARHWGATTVWPGACSDQVRKLIEKLKGHKIPGDSYVLPLPQGDR